MADYLALISAPSTPRGRRDGGTGSSQAPAREAPPPCPALFGKSSGSPREGPIV